MNTSLSFLLSATLTLILLASPKGIEATSILDTTGNWNGLTSIGVFGEGPSSLETFGQTFTVGADNVLDSFTFFLNTYADSVAPVYFGAYVMRWSGASATGPVLYQSPKTTLDLPAQGAFSQAGFQPFTFFTGGLGLLAGVQYVVFLNTSNFFDGVPDTAQMGAPYTSVPANPGGNFVFQDTGSDFSLLTTRVWSQGSSDAAFRASFSAASVPEPPTILLLGSGLLMLVSVRHRLKN